MYHLESKISYFKILNQIFNQIYFFFALYKYFDTMFDVCIFSVTIISVAKAFEEHLLNTYRIIGRTGKYNV